MKTEDKRLKRKKRIRAKIFGTKDRPRLSVFRSNKYIYAQLINDTEGKTLTWVSEKELEKKSGSQKESKILRAEKVGELLAQKAKEAKIKSAAFDRSGYRYHGRVKSFAEGARKGGLNF